MWESLFKDPFLKVILVVFAGILAFMLLFGLFSGGGAAGHMGSMNGAGYGYGTLINGLLMLLINIMILVLVIAIVAGIVVWVKNNILKDNNKRYRDMLNNDPALRAAVIIIAAIAGLALVFSLLNGVMGTGSMGYHGYGMMNTGSGFSLGVTGLLVALIKLLMFILVVSLVIAAFMYIRDQSARGAFGSTAGAEAKNDAPRDEERERRNDTLI